MFDNRTYYYFTIEEAHNMGAIIEQIQGVVIDSRSVDIALITESPYSVYCIAIDDRNNLCASDMYDWSEAPTLEDIISDFDYYMTC